MIKNSNFKLTDIQYCCASCDSVFQTTFLVDLKDKNQQKTDLNKQINSCLNCNSFYTGKVGEIKVGAVEKFRLRNKKFIK